MQELISFLPLAVLILVFYFLVFRPQQQQRKKHAAMVESLKRGDKIVTNGGFVCEVIKQDDRFIVVELGDTQVRLAREFVAYKVDEMAEDDDSSTDSKKEEKESKNKHDKK
ncbi:MAG: preprotein translocase subunit YajC [Helicobacter sp.]|uniref:Sec translocon accessory complex subunit YajC n=3 Tax=Helicobacter bilis TaxID=37372 RepID=C3XE92_9HELI|nr:MULTISPECIES: preprotein translocase subunit YajC [Helicobacter]AQQ59701.1 preprotein translocase subunit YajC [Helicobacter bilis]EEO23331.1 preprotein translocase, YajC subunit [Helicobacter bilis ATCC 43879]EMZ40674.1 preprotein translocase, YajC subunit [Helicobacter bilis WiWa]MCI7410193.1 preprotein translocase subunit YajC [Helicobacter bilis]MDD7296690.1 preprotein translocase subunit YajC [Helicobacter bilis]